MLSIILQRRLNDRASRETTLFKISSPTFEPRTEIEDCLNGQVFHQTLLSFKEKYPELNFIPDGLKESEEPSYFICIELFVLAQKQQLENLLTQEAEAIAAKYYNHSDPETINRLKLSIETIESLIDKDAKILPESNDSETKKLFLDYDKLSIAASTIKQLLGETDESKSGNR